MIVQAAESSRSSAAPIVMLRPGIGRGGAIGIEVLGILPVDVDRVAAHVPVVVVAVVIVVVVVVPIVVVCVVVTVAVVIAAVVVTAVPG